METQGDHHGVEQPASVARESQQSARCAWPARAHPLGQQGKEDVKEQPKKVVNPVVRRLLTRKEVAAVTGGASGMYCEHTKGAGTYEQKCSRNP
jgi:hypothetical protein